ncbi:hypothetical protein C8Q74DRAFT_1230133 [Fomes fomentarius]|nr:hypothetical protein C8Q74DRAFT_1230133 [Fomes fomentarius]
MSSGSVDSVDGVSGASWANETAPKVDPDFVQAHLTKCSIETSELFQEVQKDIDHIALNPHSTVTIEAMHCPVLCRILTAGSSIIYGKLTKKQKVQVRVRLQVTKLTAIEFIDLSTKSPTGFPVHKLEEKPDLLGLVGAAKYSKSKLRVSHGSIVTLVEVKADKSHGMAQALRYAYHHQQARPDKPAFICLSVKPAYYQILLSEPSGTVASPRFNWKDLGPLASFLYSLYIPPPSHFYHDATILKSPFTHAGASTSSISVSWSITCHGEQYTDGKMMSALGDAWGRRTAVFLIKDATGSHVVIKEYYWHHKRRFEESELLEAIHKDGDVPGVVRLKVYEDVKYQGKTIQCGTEEGGNLRTKKRLFLYDYGHELLSATSVNEFLRAIYDVLEVHRTLLQRGILHRDMSIQNILLRPVWREMPDRPVMKDPPPFIQDVLGGKRDPKSRLAECLLIDFDNSALLDKKWSLTTALEELARRTGTPKYIARSVSLGEVFLSGSVLEGARMPELQGEALDLYIAARGREHYESYNDSDNIPEPPQNVKDAAEKIPEVLALWQNAKANPSFHGGFPPPYQEVSDLPKEKIPKFYHRPEHDVESVFWTSFSVLSRVHPAKYAREKGVPAALYTVWDIFDKHRISDTPCIDADRRRTILSRRLDSWLSDYEPFPEMRDLGKLLYDLSLQVRPEYAVWDWNGGEQPRPDHLHEAVQRIILQYLVDHQDKDVRLNNKILRPVDTKLSLPKYTRKQEIITSKGKGKAVDKSAPFHDNPVTHINGRPAPPLQPGSEAGPSGSGINVPQRSRAKGDTRLPPAASIHGMETRRQNGAGNVGAGPSTTAPRIVTRITTAQRIPYSLRSAVTRNRSKGNVQAASRVPARAMHRVPSGSGPATASRTRSNAQDVMGPPTMAVQRVASCPMSTAAVTRSRTSSKRKSDHEEEEETGPAVKRRKGGPR